MKIKRKSAFYSDFLGLPPTNEKLFSVKTDCISNGVHTFLYLHAPHTQIKSWKLYEHDVFLQNRWPQKLLMRPIKFSQTTFCINLIVT